MLLYEVVAFAAAMVIYPTIQIIDRGRASRCGCERGLWFGRRLDRRTLSVAGTPIRLDGGAQLPESTSESAPAAEPEPEGSAVPPGEESSSRSPAPQRALPGRYAQSLTYACDLKCRYCSRRWTDTEREHILAESLEECVPPVEKTENSGRLEARRWP